MILNIINLGDCLLFVLIMVICNFLLLNLYKFIVGFVCVYVWSDWGKLFILLYVLRLVVIVG